VKRRITNGYGVHYASTKFSYVGSISDTRHPLGRMVGKYILFTDGGKYEKAIVFCYYLFGVDFNL